MALAPPAGKVRNCQAPATPALLICPQMRASRYMESARAMVHAKEEYGDCGGHLETNEEALIQSVQTLPAEERRRVLELLLPDDPDGGALFRTAQIWGTNLPYDFWYFWCPF
eukprot:SAG31_NODE_95_length_25901_cov_24.763700_11_plen_112_part_00